MKKFASIAIGVAVAGAGFGLVIVADRAGWLDRSNPPTNAQSATTPQSQRIVSSVEPAPSPALGDLIAGEIQTVALTNGTPRHLREPAVLCATQQRVVQLASADVAKRAGFRFARVQSQPVSHTLTCNAELAFNGDRLSHLAPRAQGVVKEVKKTIGDFVIAGDVLAIIDSAELGTAKADYLQAVALVNLWQNNYNRQMELSESGIAARRSVLDAQTSLAESEISQSRAMQRLRNLGLTDEQIQEVRERGETSSTLDITAPFDGVIVERHAVRGEVIDTDHTLFSIADISTMWAMLDIYEKDVRSVARGQPIVLSINGLEGEQFAGKIAWLSSSIDPNTRTLKVRADIANPDGALRANMFGLATIVIADRQDTVVVPKSAVQWEGCCNVVFVKHTDTVFQPYKVTIAHEAGDYYVVKEGISPGEEIVTEGAFLLKTEILKGSIGAGCCEVHGATEAVGGKKSG